jgi:hypothetical protein
VEWRRAQIGPALGHSTRSEPKEKVQKLQVEVQELKLIRAFAVLWGIGSVTFRVKC